MFFKLKKMITCSCIMGILALSVIPSYAVDVQDNEIENTEETEEPEKPQEPAMPETPEEIVAVRDIEIGDYEEELNVGELLTLSAVVLPSDATENTITYQSSDTGIAK